MLQSGKTNLRNQSRLFLAATFLLALTLTAPLSARDISEELLVELRPKDFADTYRYLEDIGADIAGRNVLEGTMQLVVGEGDLPTLWLLGEVSVLERSRPFRDKQRERVEAGLQAPPPEGYKTYSAVLEFLGNIEAAHPAIAKLVNITQMLGTPPTWEGRQMYALKISDNVQVDESEPAILFDALHHARELNTIEMALDIAQTITEVYATNPIAKSFVDSNEIWIVPVVNPDGLEYVWSTSANWRKNRRDNGDGTFGVDLNRNYPFLWGVCGNNSGNTGSNVYRGPGPNSEPEVQTMVALGEMLRPQINLSYHSFGQEVLPPYTCANLAEAPVVNSIRDSYRARMNYAWRFASSSGESFEWFYNQASSVAYLTEVGTSFQPPYPETRIEIRRVRKGWIRLIEILTTGPLVQGEVTDSVTGGPIEAALSSNLVNFTEGELRACESDFGRYGWFLTEVTHALTFSAPGYASKVVNVAVPATGTTVDVELDPLP